MDQTVRATRTMAFAGLHYGEIARVLNKSNPSKTGQGYTSSDIRFQLLGFDVKKARKAALEVLDSTGKLDDVLKAGDRC